jgi:hypothetical protein
MPLFINHVTLQGFPERANFVHIIVAQLVPATKIDIIYTPKIT